MKTKFLLALVDYDGCAGYPTLNAIKKNNQPLYDHLAKEAKQYQANGYDKCVIILAIGSNRQSYRLDTINARDNQNGSCANLLPGLEAGLCETLLKRNMENVDIKCCEFLMEDLYSNHAHGTTLKLIKDNLNTASKVRPPERNLFDHHKVTTIYAFMHMLTKQYATTENCSMACYFFDDKIDILTCLNHFFLQNGKHLPHNNQLFLIYYEKSNSLRPLHGPIQGTGETTTPTADTLLKFIQLFHPSFTPEKTVKLFWNRLTNEDQDNPVDTLFPKAQPGIIDYFFRLIATTAQSNSAAAAAASSGTPSINLFSQRLSTRKNNTTQIQQIMNVLENHDNRTAIRLLETLPNKSVSNDEKELIMRKVEEMFDAKKLNLQTRQNIQTMYTKAFEDKLTPTVVATMTMST